jgi:transcriptional regulator with XRE-family HTH domain
LANRDDAGIRVGRNIKIFRENLGMSQSELADAIATVGCNQQYISFIERGKRRNVSADTLEAAAKALRCTTEDLLRDV